MHGKITNVCKILLQKLKERGLLEWENNIKISLIEIGWEGAALINLAEYWEPW
jgi:hypothetical protein